MNDTEFIDSAVKVLKGSGKVTDRQADAMARLALILERGNGKE